MHAYRNLLPLGLFFFTLVESQAEDSQAEDERVYHEFIPDPDDLSHLYDPTDDFSHLHDTNNFTRKTNHSTDSAGVISTFKADRFQYTYQYNHEAFLEVWIGRSARNVGDRTGSALYHEAWHILDWMCPGHDEKGNPLFSCAPAKQYASKTNYLSAWPDTVSKETNGENGFAIKANWATDQIRRLMLGTVASIMEEGTSDLSSNCYPVAGHERFCNMGDIVRVNLPPSKHAGQDNVPYHQRKEQSNYMWVTLSSFAKQTWDNFHCCETRQRFTWGLEQFIEEYKEAFEGMTYNLSMRCMITNMDTCESGYNKEYYSCGYMCPSS